MSADRFYARAGGDAGAIEAVAALLAAGWDPGGELVAPDGTRDARSHAVTVLGILATGPDTASVMRYLREAEERGWAAARTTGIERHALARNALAILRQTAEQLMVAETRRT